MMDVDFLVSVRCMTYNHSAYIENALDGFTMQKTDFPFVCIIMDDASTDGEQEVLREYLESYFDMDEKNLIKTEETDDYNLIFARHKDNTFCYFLVFFLKYNHYGSKELKNRKFGYYSEFESKVCYNALCEGDDYWIDPYKLQKQVDIFKKNPNVALCYTMSRTFIQSQQRFSVVDNCKNGPVDFEGMLLREPTLTLTCLYRRELFLKYMEEIKPKSRGWLMGDTPLWLWLSLHGEIVMLNDITAVYRLLEESASHTKNIDKLLRFNKSAMDIRIFFCEKYNRIDLIPDVVDLYWRCCTCDAASNRMLRLCFDSFKEIKKKKLKDYINMIRYLLNILL